MFGRIVDDAGSLDMFRRTFGPLSGSTVSDEYFSRSRVRAFFDRAGDTVGGYIVNGTPPFRHLAYIPDDQRHGLPLDRAQRIAEVTCIWMVPHGRGPLLRYRIYGRVVLDAVRSRCVLFLDGTTTPKVRQVQQQLMRHDLWHGVDVHSRERWVYYALRREMAAVFLAELTKTAISVLLGRRRRRTRPRRHGAAAPVPVKDAGARTTPSGRH
jgi:hypothetical protein